MYYILESYRIVYQAIYRRKRERNKVYFRKVDGIVKNEHILKFKIWKRIYTFNNKEYEQHWLFCSLLPLLYTNRKSEK